MKSKTELKNGMALNNPFGYFYFFPLKLTIWLVYFVVVIFMETYNASAALNTWLAFNVIYPSHSTGKQRFVFIAFH